MRKLPCNIASWCATIVVLTPNRLKKGNSSDRAANPFGSTYGYPKIPHQKWGP